MSKYSRSEGGNPHSLKLLRTREGVNEIIDLKMCKFDDLKMKR